MNYSPELKDALLRRMLPPNNESITKISREEGISEQTLRNWRDKARKAGYAAPGTDAVPDDWSTQDKFLVVVETASMNETELAEYARKKGLYVEQIKAWKDACMNANGGIAKEASRLNRELKDSEKERRKLEKELQRNPYAESLFKTLKYRPNYQPKGFETLEEAREWVSLFVKWYNHDHHHSGLNFLTPYQRRSGSSDKIRLILVIVRIPKLSP